MTYYTDKQKRTLLLVHRFIEANNTICYNMGTAVHTTRRSLKWIMK